jgi:hypothetical protein
MLGAQAQSVGPTPALIRSPRGLSPFPLPCFPSISQTISLLRLLLDSSSALFICDSIELNDLTLAWLCPFQEPAEPKLISIL